MKKIMFMLVAVAAMASSCTQSDVIGLSSDDNVEIRVSAGITSAVSPSTWAVLEGMINSGFTTDLDVSFVRADEGSSGYTTYGATALIGTVAHAADALSFAPAEYYLASGKKTKLIGWYPRRSGVSYAQGTRVVDFGEIDGKTDLMATVLYEGSKGANIPSIAFNHLLTQFSIKVYTPDAAAQGLWGTVNSIKIAEKKQTCTITLPAATETANTAAAPTFTGNSDLDLIEANPAVTPATVINYPLTLGVGTTTDAVLAGYAMFAPQTAGNVVLKIELSVGGTQTVNVPVPTTPTPAGFLHGHAYEITLKFSSSAITPTVSVVDWVPVTNLPEVEI